VKYVLRAGKPADPSSLLVACGQEVALVDGNSLQRLWTFNTTKVNRQVMGVLLDT